MSGERLDYSIERQRHAGFVGRDALLARLDQLLIADDTDRWVVVTGGPGMGKSALLAAWLARRETAGAVVPHHFIRRGEYDWDDPAKLVASLIAQLEARFPDQREPEADQRKHPAARLVAMLMRVSAKALAPHGERLVVLIDGLDEYDAPDDPPPEDPLAAFLPHALPLGVSFLCASRPRHPYLPMLETRDGELARIDLDDPDAAADNDATVRAFWDRAAPPLGLDAGFIDEAVARAGGNLQHAVTLRKHLAGLPPAQRRVQTIPRGLAALLVKLWTRIATDPIAVRGLGILCAAREALTLDELAAVAGWTDEAQRQAFVRGASELLVETPRTSELAEYRLHHESIRAHIAATLGPAVIRDHHAALARRLATWPPPADAFGRRYALRHALGHRTDAGGWADAWRLAADLGFLEAKCRASGTHDAEVDLARAGERCRTGGDAALARRFHDLARAVVRESHWLRDAPEAIAALVWNRLRRSGWSAEDLEAELRLPAGATFLRVRRGGTKESPALVRELVGHGGAVNGCAVTPDGRRVVSTSSDGTLRVWDLETGAVLATLAGHRRAVRACAVTPDGHRVISNASDRTVRVWDADTGGVLVTRDDAAAAYRTRPLAVTPDGSRVVSSQSDLTLVAWRLDTSRDLVTFDHPDAVSACAATSDRLVSASYDGSLRLWDLGTGALLTTLAGHGGAATACAVTRDGRRAVSGATDHTLKVWDLTTGGELATLDDHDETVNACAVTPDGRRVISASADQTVKVWDLDTGRVLATFDGHTAEVRACAVTPDGRRVISASADRTLKVWDLDNDRGVPALEAHDAQVNACALTPDGRRAVSASRDETLKVWDLDTGRVVVTLDASRGGHRRQVNACVVTPDGLRLISASDELALNVWDLATGQLLGTLGGAGERHADRVNACAVTRDGHRLISASDDRTLKIWDLETGQTLATLAGHTAAVRACAVTRDGRRAISASDDNSLKVWDLDAHRVTATLEGHTDWVTACAALPDGAHVVSASHDCTLKVWNLDTGRIDATLAGHAAWVSACAVTPDGRRVVSASDDRTLKVWDLRTGRCLHTHRGDTTFTTVATNQTTIVAGDRLGFVWFLDWPSDESRTSSAHARYDLFLAHPSSSKPSAEALYELLQPDVRVFLDSRSLQPGDHWPREIPAAQRASRATVILISSRADAAWYLSDEIVTAIALHRAAPTEHLLVPVLLEPGLKLPYGLAAIQAIDATTAGGLNGVAAQLRAVVARLRGE